MTNRFDLNDDPEVCVEDSSIEVINGKIYVS